MRTRRFIWLLLGALFGVTALGEAALGLSVDPPGGQSSSAQPGSVQPSSAQPSSAPGQLPSPTSSSPMFGAPSLGSPSLGAPAFSAPTPAYVAPTFGSPAFGGPSSPGPSPAITGSVMVPNNIAAEPNSEDAWLRPWLNSATRTGFYLTLETLVLHRDNSSINQPIVVNSFSGSTVMTTRDLGFTNWAPGGRVIAGYRFDNGSALEATWIGFQDFNASAYATKYGSLSTPGPLGYYSYDFSQANNFHVGYSSQLQNFELNWLVPFGRTTFLSGFRYLSWNEFFDVTGTASYRGAPETSDYSVGTYNNLFGAQIGSRTQGDWKRLHWDITDKVGLFGNEFWQRSLIQDYGNTAVYEDNWLSHAGVAFVADLSLNAGFRITDYLMLRGGYNLILIDGLALAPNQLDFNLASNSGTAHNHQGSVFLQGVSGGLEARW